MDTTQVVWRPTPEVIERSRIARLMKKLQVPSIEALQKRSVEEPEWYWDAVVRDLGLRWSRPYTRVLDESRGMVAPLVRGRTANFTEDLRGSSLMTGVARIPQDMGRRRSTKRTLTTPRSARDTARERAQKVGVRRAIRRSS